MLHLDPRSLLNAVYAHTVGELALITGSRQICFSSADELQCLLRNHPRTKLQFNLRTTETVAGLVFVHANKEAAYAQCDLLDPSFVVEGVDEVVQLVYLLDASPEEIEEALVEFRNHETEQLRVTDAFPVPGDEHWISQDDIATLEAGLEWSLHSVRQLRKCFEEMSRSNRALKTIQEPVTIESEPLHPDGGKPLNDALIYGEIPHEVWELPIRISTGAFQEEKFWKTTPDFKFGDFIISTLSKHTPGKKNGPCFVTGSVADKKRIKNSILGLYLMGLDVDSGASLKETFAKVRDMGLCAVFYTTHSHLATELRIKQQAYHKWCEDNGHDTDPTDDMIRAYLRDEGKYVEDVIQSAEYIETVHDGTGIHHVLRTRPIDKFRIIFPLKRPYVIAEQKKSQRDAILHWEAMVLGMGAVLGIPIDRAARDPSRLFFLPRHARNSHFEIKISGGEALDWTGITSINPKERLTADPFDQAAVGLGGNAKVREAVLPNGSDLIKWAVKRADGFKISDVFHEYAADRLRGEVGSGKYTCECPFDDEHSNAGDDADKGCFIEDAGSSSDQFRFHCSHNACSGRDRLDMLAKAIQEQWFPDSVLYDERYDGLVRSEGEISDNRPDDGIARGLDGALQLSSRCEYICAEYRGREVIGYKGDSKISKVDPICQVFKIPFVAEDTHGVGATLIIRFRTSGGGPEKEIQLSRQLLIDQKTTLAPFYDASFLIYDDREFIKLLKSMVFEPDTILVSRSGFHESSFVHPSGEQVFAAGRELRKNIRHKHFTMDGDWVRGTHAGWVSAVAEIFSNGAKNKEQFGLGIMAGGAGLVSGFIDAYTVPVLNLSGPSSKGKSSSQKLAASVCAAPTAKGNFFSLRKTDNSMEAVLSSRSGLTFAFDEAKLMDPDILDRTVWMMSSGQGKARGTPSGDTRVGKDFNGFAVLSSEIPLSQKLDVGGRSQPGGFNARVCDVDVSGVTELRGEEKVATLGAIQKVCENYGHAWRPIVLELLRVGEQEVAMSVDTLAQHIAGAESDSYKVRCARVLALVWYAGQTMQRLRLLPSDCELERIIRWAWDARVAEGTRDGFTAAMMTLNDAIRNRRGFDIIEWVNRGEKLSSVEERRYRETVGFLFDDRGRDVLLITGQNLSKLAGGNIGQSGLVKQMKAKDLLALSRLGTKPSWSDYPDGTKGGIIVWI